MENTGASPLEVANPPNKSTSESPDLSLDILNKTQQLIDLVSPSKRPSPSPSKHPNLFRSPSERQRAEVKHSLTRNLSLDHKKVTRRQGYRQSFMGFTVHWLNLTTLERNSKALACRRMIGKHTYEAIAELIDKVLIEFDLQSKTTLLVTDNAANFVKAIKVFNTNEIDIQEAEKDGTYKVNSRRVFSKRRAIFNKQNQSSQCADKIKEILGRYLITPNAISFTCALLQTVPLKSPTSPISPSPKILKTNSFSSKNRFSVLADNEKSYENSNEVEMQSQEISNVQPKIPPIYIKRDIDFFDFCKKIKPFTDPKGSTLIAQHP
ncbi:Uncharacterized protein FWK35_00033326, partial [Aphis craccivora]